MSEYYDHTGFPSTGSAGLSSSMRAELVKVETGFSKLPTMTGNGNKAVVVASSGTSLSTTTGTLTLSGNFTKAASHALTLTTTADTDVTLPTSGTLASLTATQTFTNKTLTSPVISGAWAITTTTQTGHAIGTSATSGVGMNTSLTATGPGSSAAYGFASLVTLTGGVSDAIAGYAFTTTVVKAGSGTHATIDGVLISPPTISGSATGTQSCALRVTGASGSGATNLFALKVDAGTTSLGGLLDISGASAGQIKFPATQNASADANTLDDYEEGSWTPSIGGTATYTSRAGRYVKIGRQVTVVGQLHVNVRGTGSLDTITGLPFTSANEGIVFNGSCTWSGSSISFVYMCAQVAANSTSVVFPNMQTAGSGQGFSSVFTNGTEVEFTVTYLV